jgi:chromosome segregation ATPase
LLLTQPEEFRRAFDSLNGAIDHRVSSLRREVSLLQSVKATLENELSSVVLERELVQQDFNTLNDNHSALTGAYHSLSLESALATRSSGENEQLRKVVTGLEEQLQEVRMQVTVLEMRLRTSETECKTRLTELQTSEKLVQSLQRKLRELGEGKNVDTREYLDTFEEVLREEMTAMKGAFESKLRQAREDAEAMSRKHQVEIGKLQSVSSLTSLGIKR